MRLPRTFAERSAWIDGKAEEYPYEAVTGIRSPNPGAVTRTLDVPLVRMPFPHDRTAVWRFKTEVDRARFLVLIGEEIPA